MKKNELLLSILVLLLFALPSCKKEVQVEVVNQKEDFDSFFKLEDSSLDFQLDIFFKKDNMLSLDEKETESIVSYFRKKFPEKKFDKVLQLEGKIGEDKERKIFIVTVAILVEYENRMNFPLGIEFHTSPSTDDELTLRRKISGGSIASQRVTHMCSGAPCSCCSFVRQPFSHNIVGCSCEQGPMKKKYCLFDKDQQCNHTITETQEY